MYVCCLSEPFVSSFTNTTTASSNPLKDSSNDTFTGVKRLGLILLEMKYKWHMDKDTTVCDYNSRIQFYYTYMCIEHS